MRRTPLSGDAPEIRASVEVIASLAPPPSIAAALEIVELVGPLGDTSVKNH